MMVVVNPMSLEAELILQSWFDSSVQPTQTMLWISAIAPEATRGDIQLLRQLLQRKDEKPDAMARQRGSARYGTCLLARALTAMKPDLETLYRSLVTLDFLRRPDTILKRTIPEDLMKHVQKLVNSKYDPTPAWEKHIASAAWVYNENLTKLSNFLNLRNEIAPITITSY